MVVPRIGSRGQSTGLAEESVSRIAKSALIKNRQFATQGQTFGPVAAQAFAEGELRAEAEGKRGEAFDQQKINIEQERIAENKRQFDISAREARKARKAAEPTFIQGLFST
jgi:hypothetical protein